MNRELVWLHSFSRERFRGVLKTLLVIPLICLFGSAVEFSTNPPPESKTPCDSLETWLSQDVAYIIPDRERASTQEYHKSDDCDFAVEQFWAPRDPTPDTINNEFKEEFYDRILYANAHFGTGDRTGWKTDRGRVYTAWGPPDQVEAGTGRYSFEIWRYLNREKHYGLEGSIEFEDPTGNGTYGVLTSATAQRALSRIPNTRYDVKENADGGIVQILCGRPPRIQFRDLETVLNVGLAYDLLPFTCRIEHVQVTECTALVLITVEVRKKDLACPDGKHNQPGTAEVFGMVRRDKNPLDIFEGTLSAMSPEGLRKSPSADFLRFKKVVPLFPGTYRLELAIRDSATGNVGTLYKAITVP